MKKIAFIIFFICNILCSHAQLKMDVLNMTVSNLKKETFGEKEYIKGKDTVVLVICREHDRNTPFLEVDLEIRNTSDSAILLQPYKYISKMYLSFRMNEILYKEEVYFYWRENAIKTLDENLILEPDQSLKLFSSAYIAHQGSLLEIAFLEMDDRTLPVMQILPTLKFEYCDVGGLAACQDSVLNVKIQDHPTSLEQSFSEFDMDELFKTKGE